MRIWFSAHGWEDYPSWTGDREVLAGIDQEHRLVYTVDGDDLSILQARHH